MGNEHNMMNMHNCIGNTHLIFICDVYKIKNNIILSLKKIIWVVTYYSVFVNKKNL